MGGGIGGGKPAWGTQDADYRYALCKATLEGVETHVRFLTLKQALEARDKAQARTTSPSLAYFFVTDRAGSGAELTWADLPAEPKAIKAIASLRDPERRRGRKRETVASPQWSGE